jgi:hypothetical protein
MGADTATIADRGARTDDAVWAEQHVGPESGCGVHDGRRVSFAPLREALALAVEVPEQPRHTHGHGRDGEAATERGFPRGELIRERSLHDENRGAALARIRQLGRITGEDEAVTVRVVWYATVRCDGVVIPLEVLAHVRMLALNSFGAKHGTSSVVGTGTQRSHAGGWAGYATAAVNATRAVTLPLKSSHAWFA